MKKILVINGSASENSSSRRIIDCFGDGLKEVFDLHVFNGLKMLPHFDPELSVEKAPSAIVHFRSLIENADGVVVCTPEYIFSIPSGLKNAIEWCVATTVFADKPAGLITASANGKKGHEELQLLMRTLGATLSPGTTLLIQGVKGKVNPEGQITDNRTREDLVAFAGAFIALVGAES